MADISAKDIQKLRHDAGVGMMDAKKALTDAEGDLEKAFELLRERGQAKMAKRADREANEGTIGSYIHIQNGRPVMGVLVELSCETDFVAKSDEFQQMANDLAMHVAAARPDYVRQEDVPEEVIAKEKELIAAQARNEGKKEEIIDRIVDGRIKSFFAENVLYEQQFVRSERFDGTVGDMVQQLGVKMGENISVNSFVRLQVGDGAS